jgi:hypothetical protein
MRIKIQLIIESQAQTGVNEEVAEVATLERSELSAETLGLRLEEAKEVLAAIQKVVATRQVSEYVEQHSSCLQCGAAYRHKGEHHLVFRTLFGKLALPSPRYFECQCQKPASKPASFSPLARLLKERTAPQFAYLQSKWSALMSYGLTARLLEEVLPLDKPVRNTTLIRNVHKVAERSESELGPEQFSFIEGCPNEWGNLPLPDAPLAVSIDGGYVHAREANNRKAGWFEVIVGKSVPTGLESEGKAGHKAKCFGFVNNYDTKPKRRLYELLRSQGMQNNQEVTFLSDGGDSVRQIQVYLNPQATFILDWFHLTMRLTVLFQFVKALSTDLATLKVKTALPPPVKGKAQAAKEDEDELDYPTPARLEKELERVKWYLWHGNVLKALQVLGDLAMDLECCELDKSPKARLYQKIWKPVREFRGYIV